MEIGLSTALFGSESLQAVAYFASQARFDALENKFGPGKPIRSVGC